MTESAPTAQVDQWQARLDRAWELWEDGALLAALDTARSVLAETPPDEPFAAVAHLMLAYVYFALAEEPGRDADADLDEGIEHLALGEPAATSGDHALFGIALFDAYLNAEPDSARDDYTFGTAIAQLEAVDGLLECDADKPHVVEAAVVLGVLLHERDSEPAGAEESGAEESGGEESGGEESDHERALILLRGALPVYTELDEHDPEIRLMAGAALGRLSAARHNEHGGRADLDTAISCLTEVVEAGGYADVADDAPETTVLPSSWTDRWLLADLLRRRAALDHARGDAERGIALLRPIAEALDLDRPECGDVLHDLVLLYAVRNGENPPDPDIDALIDIARAALPVMPSPEASAHVAVILGLNLVERAARRARADVGRMSGGDPDMLAARALLTDHLEDLEEDPEAYEAALLGALVAVSTTLEQETRAQQVDGLVVLALKARTLCAPGSEEDLLAVSILGIALADRAGRTRSAQTLMDAITTLEQAVQLTPRERPQRGLLRMALGGARLKQGVAALDCAGAQAGLDQVVEGYRELPPQLRASWMAADVLGRAVFDADDQDLPDVELGPALELLEHHLDDAPPTDPVRRGEWLTYMGSARTLVAFRRESRAELDRAIATLVESVDMLPHGHTYRCLAMVKLAVALAARYAQDGDASDLDAAAGHVERARRELPADGDGRLVEALDILDERLEALRSRFAGPAPREPEAKGERRVLADGIIPPSLIARVRAGEALETLMRADDTADVSALRTAIDELFRAAESLPVDAPDRAALLGTAAGMLFNPRFLVLDRDLLTRGIHALRESLRGPVAGTARSTLLYHLSFLLSSRYDCDRREADRLESLERARQAVEAAHDSSVSVNAVVRFWLAFMLREAPDADGRAEAVRTGLDALAGLTTEVFLQGDARNALVRTRSLAEKAIIVAGWCLEDGMPADAVSALELGRGLLLHAATAAVDIGDLLDLAERPDLAAEWRRDAGDAVLPTAESMLTGGLESAFVPPALRKRVLDALADVPQARARLVSVPDAAEIAAGLRTDRRDALLYLIAATEDMPGRAVTVMADGRVRTVELPGLDAQPGSVLATFIEARRNHCRPPATSRDLSPPYVPHTVERWRPALDRICTWAWTAVIEPVLRALEIPRHADGRPPAIVLAPIGVLGIVPWHAARSGSPAERDEDARPHYAIDDAVFSYASSARQFLETAARPHPKPGRAPLFLADTMHDLHWASVEAAAIRAAHYPQAPYLGRLDGLPDVEVSPQDLLARLGGQGDQAVSMLHIACHGESRSSPLESCLYMTDEAPLETRAVLRQAFSRTDRAPGGLVVLGSCLSDASEQDHDEALTVATAFVTAGASSVVGTLWKVPDRRSALLMFMFHHFLAGGSRPAEALRGAQLWMLDPRREVPPEMPRPLATAAASPPESSADRLEEPDCWAAFVHHGW